MSLDRGPWRTFTDYLIVTIGRERAWMASLSADLELFTKSYDGQPEEYMSLMDTYSRLVPHLITALEESFQVHQPVLTHPDLYQRNILVSANDHAKIVGVLDWEWSSVFPLGLTSLYPDLMAGSSIDPSPGDPEKWETRKRYEEEVENRSLTLLRRHCRAVLASDPLTRPASVLLDEYNGSDSLLSSTILKSQIERFSSPAHLEVSVHMGALTDLAFAWRQRCRRSNAFPIPLSSADLDARMNSQVGAFAYLMRNHHAHELKREHEHTRSSTTTTRTKSLWRG